MNDKEKLLAVMNEEVDAVENLLDIMKNKQKAIISMANDDLQENIDKELKMVSLTKSLERQRLDIVQRIVPESNYPSKITISELINNFEGEESKRLLSLKQRLMESLEQMKDVNEINRLLIERGKKFVKENISILTSHGEKNLVNKKV
jgi:flagellar biosynthesis/type III secretory pathway chaperone